MSLRVVDFSPELKPFFKSINEEWVSEMFQLEKVDKEILEDPEKHILNRGGAILFAVDDELGPIGTCALLQTAPGEFELIKMGVFKKARGLSAGHLLLQHILEKANELNAKKLYLMTNQKCEAAIHLYKKFGFESSTDILKKMGPKYSRCDVAMEYRQLKSSK